MSVPTTVKPNDKLKNALSTQPQQPETSLESMIQKATTQLGKALPAHMNAERIVRIALTCIRQNPELSKCTPASFLGSLFSLAATGLEPINGLAYLLPFNNKKKVNGEWTSVKEVQALIGYKGYLNLFYRHDSALSIDVQTVRQNDDFSYEHGTNAFLKHRPAYRDRGNPMGFYAVAKLKGGASLFHYMSAEETYEHGKSHSKTFDTKTNSFYTSSPWASDFEAMSKKTVLLQLTKVLPLSFELQKAISVDETSRDYRSGAIIDSALDLPVTTNWEKSENTVHTHTNNNNEVKEAITIQPSPSSKVEPDSFDAFNLK